MTAAEAILQEAIQDLYEEIAQLQLKVQIAEKQVRNQQQALDRRIAFIRQLVLEKENKLANRTSGTGWKCCSTFSEGLGERRSLWPRISWCGRLALSTRALISMLLGRNVTQLKSCSRLVVRTSGNGSLLRIVKRLVSPSQ
jgi:hypothetical protein